MKTSVNEIKEIDGYVNNTIATEERLVIDARMILDPIFRVNVLIQRKLHHLLRVYGRNESRQQLEKIHADLFNNPSKADFQNQINSHF